MGWMNLLCALAGTLSGAPGLMLNEDNSHFYGFRTPEEMTEAGLNAFVDQYAGTKVSHLFLNPSAMRTSYKSEVWDSIWEVGAQKVPEDNLVAKRWVENARLLWERGLDPYKVWTERCRQKGIAAWLSVRMNDVHDVSDPTNYMHSTFWVKHPEYWRVPGSTAGGWTDRALNFGIEAVREHYRQLIRELLTRYDVDGIELDWMRFGWYFKPGEEPQGAATLTVYMREMRALTNEWSEKRGHPVLLGARVPTLPEAARGLGMDGVTWVKEGLVDVLVPTPFWATGDYDIPIERWREQCGPAVSKVVLAAGQEILLRAYSGAPSIENDIESVRGFAAGVLHRGADTIYLFNYMDKAPMVGGEAAYRTLLEEGLSLEAVTAKPRRHIVTYRDTVAPGMSSDAQLPAGGHSGKSFRIYLGPAPKQGVALVRIGLAAGEGVETASFDVSVNTAACKAIADHPSPAGFPGSTRVMQFEVPLSALKDGYNEVKADQPAAQKEQQIVWAEIRIDPQAKG